jgi:hypothetical protein
LLVAGLLREKSTVGWWLISQANGALVSPLIAVVIKLTIHMIHITKQNERNTGFGHVR